jgi:uncharacterized membrane protein YdjX (TVP38/TMEM64 family)
MSAGKVPATLPLILTTMPPIWSVDALRAWVEGFGIWAPLAFVLVEALQVVIAPIPGSVSPAVGTVLFGPVQALVLTLTGSAIGSTLVFVLARRWGRPLAERLLGPESFRRYSGLAANGGGLWFFLAMLVPVLPGDVVCVLAAVSPLSFPRFMLVIMFGRLPGTVLSIYLADRALEIAWSLRLVAIVAVPLVVAALLTTRFRGQVEAWFLRWGNCASGKGAKFPAADPARHPDSKSSGDRESSRD